MNDETSLDGLEVVVGTDPLTGWRWVRTLRIDDRIFCASIIDHRGPGGATAAYPVVFAPEATARCQSSDHDAPAPGCKCGFWSVPDRSMLDAAVGPRRAGWALARVELAGTVIEAERGMRASRQRILRVAFADRCEDPGCIERSDGLAPDGHGFLRAACAAHGATVGFADAAGDLRTEVGTAPLAAGDRAGPRPDLGDGIGAAFTLVLGAALFVAFPAGRVLSEQHAAGAVVGFAAAGLAAAVTALYLRARSSMADGRRRRNLRIWSLAMAVVTLGVTLAAGVVSGRLSAEGGPGAPAPPPAATAATAGSG